MFRLLLNPPPQGFILAWHVHWNLSVLLLIAVSSIYIYRAQISNGLWPTSPSNLLVTWIALVCMLYWDNKYIKPITSRLWAFGDLIYLDNSHHLLLRIFVISLIVAIGFFIVVLYARQYALRILLSYRGWMCKSICNILNRFKFIPLSTPNLGA